MELFLTYFSVFRLQFSHFVFTKVYPPFIIFFSFKIHEHGKAQTTRILPTELMQITLHLDQQTWFSSTRPKQGLYENSLAPVYEPSFSTKILQSENMTKMAPSKIYLVSENPQQEKKEEKWEKGVYNRPKSKTSWSPRISRPSLGQRHHNPPRRK